MTNFICENNFLVLSKSVKQTKKDENGVYKEYGSISLYCPDLDEFQKITIFDKYKEVLNRYEVLKTYKMKIQVSIVTKDNKSTTYMKIL